MAGASDSTLDAQLRELFLQAPFAISLLRGPELRYELANGPYLEMVAKPDLTGRTMAEAFPEVVGTPIYDLFERVLRTGEPFAADEYKTALVRRGILEDCYFKFNLVATRERGAITGLMCTAVEITDQVRARQALQAALELGQAAQAEAERANRAKDEFLAVLGHELRNPMTPILAAVELLRTRDGDAADERVAQSRAVIERQVHHMVRLVDDLLDVSRITSGKITLVLQRIELAEVVAMAIELASPMLEQRRQDLAVEVAARGLALDGDPTRLAQVISNLLTNAVKYSERGARIAVTAHDAGGQIIVRVRDEGMGIAPDVLPRIFDAFAQERQALDRASGGLGLGLAIVKSLVMLHGGTVEAHSAGRGHGTEVVVRLPALASRRVPGTTGPIPVARAPRRPRRILLVDDNEDAAEMLATYLELQGHTTLVANDGPSALKQVAAFAPDLALLDVGLPVMSGYELARRLRAEPGLGALELIAITGYGQDSDRARSLEAGFDLHLVKPVSPARLAALIDERAG